jgi:hypothetical protein
MDDMLFLVVGVYWHWCGIDISVLTDPFVGAFPSNIVRLV